MIDIKELRFGNYVLDGVEIVPVDIYVVESLVMYPHAYDPVPLDHVLLTNHNTRFYDYDTSEFSMMYIKQGDIIAGPFPKSVPLIYLHQVQNLFFALTGKELNYTP